MFLKKRTGDDYESFIKEVGLAKNEGIFLTDTHSHLHFPELINDVEQHIADAKSLGVNRFVTIGINKEDSRKAIDLAERFEMIYASVGVHPHDASGFNVKEIDLFREYLQYEKVIAIGEIGLDYFRNHSPSEKQKDVFAIFLDMAKAESVPVIIHNREATSDLLEVADSVLCDDTVSGIIHCFNGDKDLMKWALDRDFFISFAGNLTYNKANELRDCLRYIPLNNLLLETDCPYLSPMPFRGKKNVPAHVIYTAYTACKVKKIDYQNLLINLEENFGKLLGISYARHINS
jgi:TatD DNase family protein